VNGDCKNHLNNTCKHGNNIASLAATPAEARIDHEKHDGHGKHHDRDNHHKHRDDDESHGKSRKRPVIVISNYGMGHAPTELGLKLVQTYLNLLDLDDRLPTAVCLYGEGVKLAVEGSPVLEELRSLAA
jgi:hypothetical protein